MIPRVTEGRARAASTGPNAWPPTARKVMNALGRGQSSPRPFPFDAQASTTLGGVRTRPANKR